MIDKLLWANKAYMCDHVSTQSMTPKSISILDNKKKLTWTFAEVKQDRILVEKWEAHCIAQNALCDHSK